MDPDLFEFTKIFHHKPYPFISPNRTELNVIGTFNTLTYFAAVAVTGGNGKRLMIFNASSGLARFLPAPAPGMSSYVTRKASGVKMLDYFAVENPDSR